MIKLKIARDTL